MKIFSTIGHDEAYLIQNKTNLHYLSGFKGSSGLILGLKNETHFLTNPLYYEEAKKLIKNTVVHCPVDTLKEIYNICLKKKIKKIYTEETYITLHQYRKLKKALKEIKILPQENFIENFRAKKSEKEIKFITKSLRLAEKTLLKTAELIRPGISEIETAWLIEKIGREMGAEDISFPPIIGFGKHTSAPHHQNTSLKLKQGMPVLIDMGLKYKGYCSDITRVFFTKSPTGTEEKIYNTVLNAQIKAIDNIKPGMTGADADSIARNYIIERNFGKQFSHGLGHGIGLDVHETPSVSPKGKSMLAEVNIITIEPGIYLENSFGVRIEDMVLVNGDKIKNLTRIPKQLKNLILKI